VAFAAGAVLNIQSGRHVELEQRTTGRHLWAADDCPSDPQWTGLASGVAELDPQRRDFAVAVGLTHDIATDVRRYRDASVPTVGRLLTPAPRTGTGAQSVTCGRHAFELAEAATKAIRDASWDSYSPVGN
jgi:hypothetical protein